MISLASAFHPRGEIPRLAKFLPPLRDAYARLCVSVPPTAHADDVNALRDLNIAVAVTRDWSHGRHAALQLALESNATHIHYTDLDRLLRWVETCPDEWRAIVARAQTCDGLIIGRTPRAYATHPRALVETEAISNLVGSYLLGAIDAETRRHGDTEKPSPRRRVTVSPCLLDLSAGSKSFSRRAAEYLIAHSIPGRALGMDAEWPLLLHRAGFAIEYVEVEGLDWESADQFADNAADAETQRRAAERYDADPKHWARRVEVAMEIVAAGFDAMQRELKTDRFENRAAESQSTQSF
jgi:hypothetical protein